MLHGAVLRGAGLVTVHENIHEANEAYWWAVPADSSWYPTWDSNNHTITTHPETVALRTSNVVCIRTKFSLDQSWNCPVGGTTSATERRSSSSSNVLEISLFKLVRLFAQLTACFPTVAWQIWCECLGPAGVHVEGRWAPMESSGRVCLSWWLLITWWADKGNSHCLAWYSHVVHTRDRCRVKLSGPAHSVPFRAMPLVFPLKNLVLHAQHSWVCFDNQCDCLNDDNSKTNLLWNTMPSCDIPTTCTTSVLSKALKIQVIVSKQ